MTWEYIKLSACVDLCVTPPYRQLSRGTALVERPTVLPHRLTVGGKPMATEKPEAQKATDDCTDDETTDCGCSAELACYVHFEPSADRDGDRRAASADRDGGETDDGICLGDTYQLVGVAPVCEVAMFTHNDDAVVFETMGTNRVRSFTIPKFAIKNSDIAVPA